MPSVAGRPVEPIAPVLPPATHHISADKTTTAGSWFHPGRAAATKPRQIRLKDEQPLGTCA
ncbi:MAG: hypothetical protein RMJ56_00935 [Gemmataceae bacterium]|nr:hypothetical protein [Gemmata sp.]MDW8196146.1 hypothetical protein [Gemmataceae bacterium]